jgi:hypothetical protein
LYPRSTRFYRAGRVFVYCMDGEVNRASESRLPSLPARATVAGFSRWNTGVSSCCRSIRGREQVVVVTGLDKPLDVGNDGHEDATSEAPTSDGRDDPGDTDHHLLFGSFNSRRRTRTPRRLLGDQERVGSGTYPQLLPPPPASPRLGAVAHGSVHPRPLR